MGSTKIEWTDKVWNPVTGCTKVSQGCKNCYAERVFPRAYKKDRVPIAPSGKLVLVSRAREFTDVQTHPDRLDQPLRWKKPRRIFVNSMSDLFHESVPDAFIDEVLAVCWIANWHTYQILTKRAERMPRYFSDPNLLERLENAANRIHDRYIKRLEGPIYQRGEIELPLPNVHLGVSIEDQKTADERIPLLLQTPAAVRFISAEPLLGPIDLTTVAAAKIGVGRFGQNVLDQEYQSLDWVIVGGESGPNARPMHPDWARSLRDQCQAAGVPFFFKQWGEWKPISEMPESEYDKFYVSRGYGLVNDHISMLMFNIGKKAAGAKLDGVEWKQFPTNLNVLNDLNGGSSARD